MNGYRSRCDYCGKFKYRSSRYNKDNCECREAKWVKSKEGEGLLFIFREIRL